MAWEWLAEGVGYTGDIIQYSGDIIAQFTGEAEAERELESEQIALGSEQIAAESERVEALAILEAQKLELEKQEAKVRKTAIYTGSVVILGLAVAFFIMRFFGAIPGLVVLLITAFGGYFVYSSLSKQK